jgi:ribosomal protein L29
MKKEEEDKIKSMTVGNLQKFLLKERKKALELKMQMAIGKLKDLHSYKKKRKKIAFVLTVLKEKQLKTDNQAGKESNK